MVISVFDCFVAVFNLANGIDVEETKRKVDNYKKENQELIKKNRSKLVKKCLIPKTGFLLNQENRVNGEN